jgi:uncharacterized membrane protein YesL
MFSLFQINIMSLQEKKKKIFFSSKFSILFFKLNYIIIIVYIFQIDYSWKKKKKPSIYNYSQILEILN